MAQLIVRNIEEQVKAGLRRRAAEHERSMEEEVREILRNAVNDTQSPSLKLGSRLRSRFAAIGLDDDIQEMRGEPVLPATFEE